MCNGCSTDTAATSRAPPRRPASRVGIFIRSSHAVKSETLVRRLHVLTALATACATASCWAFTSLDAHESEPTCAPAPLDHDAKNCGRCGHDCLGGECSGG